MTWHTAASFIVLAFVYHNVWLIETYFGWCGTPLMSWQGEATLVGAVGSVIAVRGLIQIWQAPGLSAAISRIIHMTLLIGFTVFLLRNYARPDLELVCAFASVVFVGSSVALIKNRKWKKVSNQSAHETKVEIEAEGS